MARKDDNTFTETLYNYLTGDEDARVCKDIPESACDDQPRNFSAYLAANFFSKLADEAASAKLILPWLFGALGVPAFLTGFLVPIREGGVLLPQLAVAAIVRKVAVRKKVWVLGALLSAISLLVMAYVALKLDGIEAGAAILVMLLVFSVCRGLCSVSAKDVLGKTISKSRRGKLMGWSASFSGIAVLILGLYLGGSHFQQADTLVFAGLLAFGGCVWIVAALFFSSIIEQPGATEGGGNAISVAFQQLSLLKSDPVFRQFVIARGLLLSVALSPPFFVLAIQENVSGALLGLGTLIIANGLGTSLSAPFWGNMGDRSSKSVMIIAATSSAFIGIFTFLAIANDWAWVINVYGFAAIFFILNVMHGGVRLGRKVYLVDMASADNRAAYVAVSNTVIGVLMLAGGLVGVVSDLLGAEVIILVLSCLSLVAAIYIRKLPDVSGGSEDG